MTTREQIHTEIKDIGDQYLDDLYDLIKLFAETKQPPPKQSFMSQLKQIQIEAPEDFTANLLSARSHVGQDY